MTPEERAEQVSQTAQARSGWEVRVWTMKDLIADAIREAVAAERERCVKVAVEAIQHHYGYSGQIVVDAIGQIREGK